MINPTTQTDPSMSAAKQAQAHSQRRVFTMVQNDRMAGSVPSWSAPSSPADHVLDKLSYAGAIDPTSPYQTSLRPQQGIHSADEAFGFGDLLDIINPLHHIPVVGHIYRDLTGDQIKPAGQVLGGAVFGGAIGAGAGMVNVIAQAETGADLATHAMHWMKGKQQWGGDQGSNDVKIAQASTDQQLENDFANVLLRYADNGAPDKAGFKAQKIAAQDVAYKGARPDINNLPARETITELKLAAAPVMRTTYNS